MKIPGYKDAKNPLLKSCSNCSSYDKGYCAMYERQVSGRKICSKWWLLFKPSR